MSHTFETPEKCIASISYDPLFFLDIRAALADEFRHKMAEILDEDELIGIDYANHFIMSRSGSRMCASHFYADISEIMYTSLSHVITRYMDDPSLPENDLSRMDVLDFANSLSNTDRANLQRLWNDSWSIVMRDGFSHLWTRRSLFESPDEFEMLANILSREPLDAFSRKFKVPAFPFETPFRDEIKDMTSELANSLKGYSDTQFLEVCGDAIRGLKSKDAAAILAVSDNVVRISEFSGSSRKNAI